MTMVLEGDQAGKAAPMRGATATAGPAPTYMRDRSHSRSVALSLAAHAIVVTMLSAIAPERAAPPQGAEKPIEVQVVAGERDSAASRSAAAVAKDVVATQEPEAPLAALDEPALAEAALERAPPRTEQPTPLRKIEPTPRSERARTVHVERPREHRPARAADDGAEASEHSSVASTRGGGRAGPSASAGAAPNVNYRALALAHLARFQKYPERARELGVIGVAVVHFTLSPRGEVVSVGLARSSGAASLDEAALAMVRRAAPFPPMADGASALTISAAVNYSLR
jgi:protein TonB